MISLIKVIVGYFSKLLGKRGELRNKDILLASKLSSSIRMSEFLSSRVLLLKFRLKSYSDLFRVSMDPRVKPEGDGRESVSEGDNSLLSSLRAVTRGQAIFELISNSLQFPLIKEGRNKIGRCLEFFALQKIGMTLIVSLFLLFPFSSYSAIYFLPDAQWDVPMNVSIDSSQCEDIGYTYYSSGQCPAYYNQETCMFMNKYLKCDGTGWCRDNSYTISSCTSPKIVDTQCPNGLSLYKYCVCPSTYKYACTGTGYGSGNGTACDGKYTKCNCSGGYVWSGSACVCNSSSSRWCSVHSSCHGDCCSDGTIESCDPRCGGSGCHTHSYSCPSGSYSSSSSCSYGTSGTVSKTCSCGATSGTCYTCAAALAHTHSYSCPSGSYSSSSSCSYGTSGTVSKTCSCGATSGTCYTCAAAPSCTPLSNETGCSYGTESCSDGCGGTRTCCKSCSNTCSSGSLSSSCTSPKTASHVATTQCGNKCYSCVCPSTYQYSCTGTGYSGGSSTACDNKYTSCYCTSGYSWDGSSCVKSSSSSSTCSDSGYYNGTSCHSFSEYTCSIDYQAMGATCSSQGRLGEGDCDVDSWRRCCEQCNGSV